MKYHKLEQKKYNGIFGFLQLFFIWKIGYAKSFINTQYFLTN